MATELILTFVLASSLLCIAPGPDNIFVLTQSTLFGNKAGVLVTLGLCTGLIAHTTAVSLGVAAIFKTSELAFTLLKVAGAVYLVYLAWQCFRSSNASINTRAASPLSNMQLYRRGIIMNVSNPKVSIFFLAFLPQFVSPQGFAPALQVVSLGLLFILLTFIIFSSIALLAGTLSKRLRENTKTQLYLNRVSGVVFVGLALKLLSAEAI